MSYSTSPSVPSSPTLPTQSFRLAVPLHNLQKDPSPTLARVEHQPRTSLALPSPVFPQHSPLLHKIDDADIAAHQAVLETRKRHWPASKVMDTMQGWMFPIFKSRILPGEFQPILPTCSPSGNAIWIAKASHEQF